MKYRNEVKLKNGKTVSFDVVTTSEGVPKVITDMNIPFHELPDEVRKAIMMEVIRKETEES